MRRLRIQIQNSWAIHVRRVAIEYESLEALLWWKLGLADTAVATEGPQKDTTIEVLESCAEH